MSSIRRSLESMTSCFTIQSRILQYHENLQYSCVGDNSNESKISLLSWPSYYYRILAITRDSTTHRCPFQVCSADVVNYSYYLFSGHATTWMYCLYSQPCQDKVMLQIGSIIICFYFTLYDIIFKLLTCFQGYSLSKLLILYFTCDKSFCHFNAIVMQVIISSA